MSYTNPGPSVTTGSTTLGLGSPITIGTDEDSLVGFYGETPVVQRSSSSQATSLVSGVSTGAVSTNSLVLAALIEVMNTLDGMGIWNGGA
jgi:hypothetical protein